MLVGEIRLVRLSDDSRTVLSFAIDCIYRISVSVWMGMLCKYL